MPVKYKIPSVLFLVTVLSVMIKMVLPEPMENSEIENEFWLTKTHDKTPKNIVVGGDSRIYRGFSIESMLAQTGNNLSGVNLGYSSAGFNTDYMNFLANRLPEKGNRFLVLGVTPHSFTLEGAKNELLQEKINVGKFEQFKGMYLSRYLKYFAPYKVEEVKDFIIGKESDELYFTEYKKTGWAKSYRIPEDTLVALSIYERIFTKYQVNDSLISQFMHNVDSLGNSGVKIIAFRLPTFYSMSRLEDSLSGFNEALMKFELEKRGGTWVELNERDFHTYDGSHLHYTSAIKLAEVIGKKIATFLPDD